MPNYRLRYSRRYFTHLDLPPGGEGDLTLTISKVDTGKLKDLSGVEEEKPFLWFAGHTKPFGCNATNGLTIAGLYGDDDAAWIGRSVTLYRSKAMYGGRLVDCIRVRPSIPSAAAGGSSVAPPAPPTDNGRGKRGRKAA